MFVDFEEVRQGRVGVGLGYRSSGSGGPVLDGAVRPIGRVAFLTGGLEAGDAVGSAAVTEAGDATDERVGAMGVHVERTGAVILP